MIDETISEEKMKISIQFQMIWMKTKKFQKNMLKKLKQLMVAIEYEKDYIKIRFKSNDDLLLNKPITLRLLTIIIRCVISEDGKFYPQLFLDDALYVL